MILSAREKEVIEGAICTALAASASPLNLEEAEEALHAFRLAAGRLDGLAVETFERIAAREVMAS